jgi:GAF domain-containing protein
MFQTMAIISLPAFVAASIYSFDEGDYFYLPIYIALLVLMFVISFWKRISDHIRIYGLLGFIYLIILLDFYTEGRGSLASSFLVVFSFLGAIFFGRRGAIITAAMGLLTMIAFAVLFTRNILPNYLVSSTVASGWWSNTVIVAAIMFLIIFSVNFLVGEMTGFLTRSQQLNQVIEAERATLEQRVLDRTAAAESARAAAEISAKEAESARKDLELQVWLATGQTQLMDVMRGEMTIAQLAENVLSHLCTYTNAHAGVLFLLEEDKLTLAGGYVYSARPGFNGIIELGEGLVGQAAREGRVIYENVPSDILVISTGLAEITPRQIAAAPFYMNEKVIGVIELATLNDFTENHLKLWERISETLGAAFHTAQTRQRLAELLVESRQQAEELQAQEEELRAANEELEAQAENLRAVRELKARKDEA